MKRSKMLCAMGMILFIAMSAAAQDRHFKHGYASVNGLKMYYEIRGTADDKSPPLVLLHGGGSTIDSTFVRILPSLAKELLSTGV